MRIPRLPVVSVTAKLATALLVMLVLVDGGSVVLTRLAVPDDVKEAGYAAAAVAEGLPTTRQTAVVAYETAQAFGGTKGLTLVAEDFTVYPDGRVRLTGSRTAPTLLLHRLPRVSDLAVVTKSATVRTLPYS